MTVDAIKFLTWPNLEISDDFHRNYTVDLQVIADRQHGPLSILTAAGLPNYGDSYNFFIGDYQEADDWAFLKKVSVTSKERIKSDDGLSRERIVWGLRLGFSSSPSGQNPAQSKDDPISWTPQVSGSFVGIRKPVHRDKDGNPIVNSADDLYVPPEETDAAFDTLNITYNSPTIDLDTRSSYVNTVNSDTIWGLGARRVKFRQWNWSVQYAGNNYPYIKNELQFEISYKQNPSSNISIGSSFSGLYGHYTVLPNVGHRYYVGGVKTVLNLKKLMDSEDQPSNEPVNLKTNGDVAPPTDDQYWNIYAIEKEMAFNSIGIPSLAALPIT